MEKVKKHHYVLIFLLALAVGVLLRGVERDSFKIVKNSTVYAPENAVTFAEANSEEENGKININTAGIGELDKIKGIGESLAQRIIDYREEHGSFEVIEDIMKVSGIGEKTFEKMKNSICVE